jgi:hypothetical protein
VVHLGQMCQPSAAPGTVIGGPDNQPVGPEGAVPPAHTALLARWSSWRQSPAEIEGQPLVEVEEALVEVEGHWGRIAGWGVRRRTHTLPAPSH